MKDCESIKTCISNTSHKNSKNDIGGLLININSSINWKKVFLLWLIYILINTEIFIDKFLVNINGCIDNNNITMKGTFIISIILVVVYIFIDLLYT